MYHFVEQISLAEDEHYLWINPEQQPIANISMSKAKQSTNKLNIKIPECLKINTEAQIHN